MPEETEVVLRKELEEVCYVAPNAPSFSLRVTIGEKDTRIKFTHKEFRTNNEALIAELDKLIKEKPNVAAIIHKVDIAKAEELARAHMAQVAAQRGTVKGPVSADDAKRSVEMAMAEREKDLAAQGATVEDLDKLRDEMAADSLALTENSKGVIAPDNRDGFSEDPKPLPLPEAEEAAKPSSIFANLGNK